MNKKDDALNKIEEAATDLEELNELINAYGLSFSSSHSQLNSKQNSLAISSIYTSMSKVVQTLKCAIDSIEIMERQKPSDHNDNKALVSEVIKEINRLNKQSGSNLDV